MQTQEERHDFQKYRRDFEAAGHPCSHRVLPKHIEMTGTLDCVPAPAEMTRWALPIVMHLFVRWVSCSMHV
jgi:hypothetical protein